jgi:hypothetical protein
MNWIKKLFQNKLYSFLLLGYLITQFIFPISELLFISATIVAIIWISKTYKTQRNFTALSYSIILNLIANLILTAIYIPTLILNPDINWSLKNGGQESDPMILLAYFPSVNFILFIIVVLIASLSIKISADSE